MIIDKPIINNNIVMGLFIFFIILPLFVLMTQPVWRGEEMVLEFVSDCDKRGGVLLTHRKMFGIEYECTSRLD